jgi:hypothetical protein
MSASEWRLRGSGFGGERARPHWLFERVLSDGTRLLAKVQRVGDRPVCVEITAKFPDGARDFGRELAITELEHAINDSDQHKFRDARTGELVSPLVFTDVPLGVPVLGSRGRTSEWTDRRLAELVRHLENGDTTHWHLARNTLRQLGNNAVRRGIAEVLDVGPPKRWKLNARGHDLLVES